ncbi:MAG: hypothetical protein KL787_05190 [Taibaiella sp.]|nr:hypothetical protein [Taibaiella sp.]
MSSIWKCWEPPYAPSTGQSIYDGLGSFGYGCLHQPVYMAQNWAVRFEMGEMYRLFEHSDNYPFYQVMKIPAPYIEHFLISILMNITTTPMMKQRLSTSCILKRLPGSWV